ncbi:flagellar biosynthesis protein FlhF [Caloramator australicus]|uniref:Flagellar biosynthesis protein FlhF n=1 Tax=Caloramator australicus RC3 TaxID=857293 RepID=I7K4Z0_9CLOT|nr:flagellar biosynthesis protein FlhF [Caloramator australicus]CCJ32614.1 Flagellar biosynthesis protein FlhF [Caloramator australicus RC3]
MIVKRYIVDNMQEAMVKIRYELGNDAVIVSQRKIRQKGFLGFFKPKKIEVTAAADDKDKKSSKHAVSSDIEKEIAELKNMVENLVKNNNKETKGTKKSQKIRIKENLLNNDVPEEIIENIIESIKKENGDGKINAKNLEKLLIKYTKELIKEDDKTDSRVQAFVGPTGVGKTTTVAKLASLYSLYKNKKVGLITIDTYRIGAVEQLKAYAEILNIPFGVIYSIKDIPNVLNQMKECDIILVDSTGRSSKNAMQIAETKKFIEEIKPDKISLVLSVTTKQRDIKSIVENYKMLDYNNIILTKLDETDIYGSILTAAYYSKKPISYITVGQNVPDDIEEANSDKLIKLVLGE